MLLTPLCGPSAGSTSRPGSSAGWQDDFEADDLNFALEMRRALKSGRVPAQSTKSPSGTAGGRRSPPGGGGGGGSRGDSRRQSPAGSSIGGVLFLDVPVAGTPRRRLSPQLPSLPSAPFASPSGAACAPSWSPASGGQADAAAEGAELAYWREEGIRQRSEAARLEAMDRARSDARARASACFEDLISFLELHGLSGAYALVLSANGVEDLSMLLTLKTSSLDNIISACDLDATDELLLRDALRSARPADDDSP